MTKTDFNRMNCNLEKISECVDGYQTANNHHVDRMISVLHDIEKKLLVLKENHNFGNEAS